MLYYPQLTTGNVAQYPLRLSERRRAVVNDALDGSRYTAADPDATACAWDLVYTGLSEAEMLALRALFEACEGRLGTFVFADPAGNLLARSEEFSQAPWQSDPQLGWTPGLADPFGGTGAMLALNAAGIPQSVKQDLDLPAAYALCVSVWARAASGSTVTLRASSGAETQAGTFALDAAWRRLELAVALTGSGAGVTIAVEVPPATSVELFGAQVEPQRAASGYRRTLDQPGLYTAARFSQDELEIAADGYRSFQTRVRIVCAPGG